MARYVDAVAPPRFVKKEEEALVRYNNSVVSIFRLASYSQPPPPPSPPLLPLLAVAQLTSLSIEPEPEPAPATPAQGGQGICTIIVYDYEVLVSPNAMSY